MAKRKPLVYVAGEAVEQSATDTLDGNNIVVTADGSVTERPLSERFADILNVKDFGAVGNGTANDTPAFIRAAAAAAQKGGVVFVPHGVYKLNQDVTGEFIAFGHPSFTGSGTVHKLIDLYSDALLKSEQDPSKGGIGVADDGSLYIDLAHLQPADPDNPDEISMEDVLASMGVPIFIDGVKIPANFYVDGGSLGLDDGINPTTGQEDPENEDNPRDWTRGRTADKPWKTIQHAIDMLTKYYNINTRTVAINIAGGNYNERLRAGNFQHTTGEIVLRPYGYTNDSPAFRDKTASDYETVKIYSAVGEENMLGIWNQEGGEYYLQGLHFELTVSAQTTASSYYSRILRLLEGSGSKANVYGCKLTLIDNTVAADSSHGTRSCALVLVQTGCVMNMYKGMYFDVGMKATTGMTNVNVLTVIGGGTQLDLEAVTKSSIAPTASNSPARFTVKGNFTNFAVVSEKAMLRGTASESTDSVFFKTSGTVTGKRYTISSGGTVKTPAPSSADTDVSSVTYATYFPGDTSGTVASDSTYAWIL